MCGEGRIRDRRSDETRRVGGVADATPGEAEARRGHGSAQSPSGDSSLCRFRGRALAQNAIFVLKSGGWVRYNLRQMGNFAILATTTHSAFRGYAWSHTPPGISEAELDGLRRLASEERGDFPEPTEISRGLVSDGRVAACYSIRTVAGWDSEGRASEYTAFAIMPLEDAGRIDLVDLLSHPFFAIPSHEPPTTIEYSGPQSTIPPTDAAGRLLCRHKIDRFDPHAAGVLLATYGKNSTKWAVRICDGGTATVECGEWRKPSEGAK